jgi:hypothetical protein
MGIREPHFNNTDVARDYLEAKLWPSGPFCPHCGVTENIYKLESKSTTVEKNRMRKGVYKCGGCRKQFTVTVGTIFEDSKIPLDKWLFATHLMCSSKKGVSALQLQRELWGETKTESGKVKINGSYRTAWFMCHRIRWAMTQSPMADAVKMGGNGLVVEVDETYVGGKTTAKKGGRPGKPGPESNKTPVLALMERGGNVRSFPIERATLKNIKPILQKHVDPTTHLVTDESSVYYMMKPDFFRHSTVNHSQKQYVRRDENQFKVTTNTVESFFSLIKRSVYGIHHHMSRKYLGQYSAERDFVYNNRRITDDARADKALESTRGKRLMLRAPKGAGKSELPF